MTRANTKRADALLWLARDWQCGRYSASPGGFWYEVVGSIEDEWSPPDFDVRASAALSEVSAMGFELENVDE
jgi:hypothetical protein